MAYITVNTTDGPVRLPAEMVDPGDEFTPPVYALQYVQRVDGDMASLANPPSVMFHRSPSTTRVSVPASLTEVTLLTARTDRHLYRVTNVTDGALYLKEGTGVSTTSFDVKIPPGAFYESPVAVFLGAITGIFELGTGHAMVSESY